MDHSNTAGQRAASQPSDSAEFTGNRPLADSELRIDENFFKTPKYTQRVEDPDDTFLMIDEDEAMTPSPASSVSGSCGDLRELPRPVPKRKINFTRAVEKALDNSPKAKNLTKGAGSVANTVFGVFGMVRGAARKNSLSAKNSMDDFSASQWLAESVLRTQFLDSRDDEFHIVDSVDADDEIDYRPLDLEPEEFLDYCPSDQE